MEFRARSEYKAKAMNDTHSLMSVQKRKRNLHGAKELVGKTQDQSAHEFLPIDDLVKDF